jgi:hypothetical protein
VLRGRLDEVYFTHVELVDALPDLLFLALVLAYPAFLLHQWRKRRAAFREFARARGLRFRGTIPSDKYPPYALFTHVGAAVLLYHVVEGHLNGFDIAVFDFPMKSGTRTGAIVSGLPVDGTPPPPPDGELSFDRQDGHLLGFRLRVSMEDLAPFVESVLAAARRAI